HRDTRRRQLYWIHGGAGEQIRYLKDVLEYTDSSYEEKRYTMGDGNATFLVRHLLPYHLGRVTRVILLVRSESLENHYQRRMLQI
uniref:Uncharacterized protein n=1 Tax=Mus spicilegus TaxID=10103 RepID=A0A8C6HJ62_MUSSI